MNSALRPLIAFLLLIAFIQSGAIHHSKACERELDQITLFELLKQAQTDIDPLLKITEIEKKIPSETKVLNLITSAMNHAARGGKRVRSLLAILLAAEHHIDFVRIIPLIKAIEYAHAASLIYDDLPAQDNASMRRNQPTVHVEYNEAIAQLAAHSLMMLAIEELQKLRLHKFNPYHVGNLTTYWTRIVGYQAMSLGQLMDIELSNQTLDVVTLERIIQLKTGLGIEAPLASIYILTGRDPKQIAPLAKSMGLLYQIKDDILDATSTVSVTGKPQGLDAQNGTPNLVSLLGVEEAQKRLTEVYSDAIKQAAAIDRLPAQIMQFIHYLYLRKK